MGKLSKIIAMILSLVMIISTLASCNILPSDKNPGNNGKPDSDSHICESSCKNCGKCTNTKCTESVCQGKCYGHNISLPEHICESKCEVCGNCTDLACTDDKCKDKCHGHTDPSPEHICESKCEVCGNCIDLACTDDKCKDKCHGHTDPSPEHTCYNKCERCEKCTNLVCIEEKCKSKCAGHTIIPEHECENVCEKCGKCLNASCAENACNEKCAGHTNPKEEAYSYFPIISDVMPAIHINTENGSNEWATKYKRSDKLSGKIEYTDATIYTTNCDDEHILSNVSAQVKVRGNYTLDYAKKPIRIKFSSKTNLLGLHDGEKYKNWVLLADWKDLSMSNNTVAFYLGNTILGSDGYYCTDFRNVEVYLNGVYWGVYLLVEQQEVKDGRTSTSEVPEIDDVGYTGNDIGYFFEYDGYYNLEANIPDGDPTFVMNHQGLPAGSKGYTVKSDIYADSQLEFLKSYMDNVFYIAYQANYKDTYYKFNEDYSAVIPAPEYTSAKEAVDAVIDLKSLVGTYILNEIARDLDVDWSSFYLSLDMSADGNKKVTFEAPWDFDSSFGSIIKENCNDPNGLYAATNANPWFRLVANEEWFWDMVYEKWAEIKEFGVLENVIEMVKTEKNIYKDYYIKNYTKWSSRVTGGNTEVVPELNTYNDINTAQGLAADYLINWLTLRFAYLDSQWGNAKEESDFLESAEIYKFEAEYANLAGFQVDNPIRTDKSYASNNSYIGNVCAESSITFTVTAEEDTTAYLFAGISKMRSADIFTNWFSVTVNGNQIFIPAREIPAVSGDEEVYHTFISLKLALIELNKGENTITLTAVIATTNVDYIELYSTEKLS